MASNDKEKEVVRASTVDSNILEDLRHYTDEVRSVLSSGNSSFITLKAFVSIRLKQFKLSGLFCEAYIINEAYLRGWDKILEEGVRIKNPIPWVRKTCFNIIRELSRKEAKYCSIETDIFQEQESEDSDFNLTKEIMFIKLAYQMLDPREREILNLKIVDGLSWKEISKEMNLRGDRVGESALRKRKERALKKLRNLYHQFASDGTSCS